MKIEFKDEQITLKEVYNSVVLETEEGNKMAICMRDDTFEMRLLSFQKGVWYRANIEKGTIDKM
jgi:acetyl-CoA acetyltransferase